MQIGKTMKVEELIQRVQSLYSKGAQSRSTRLMSRHIYNKLLSVRSLLVFQKRNKKQLLSKWNYSVIPCVELELVDPSECDCFVSPGCNLLRSTSKLPKPINDIGGYLIESVTSVDGAIQITETTYLKKNWQVDDKYTSNKPKWFIKDDYLYITITRKLKAVTIVGMFSDFMEVESFVSACASDLNETCPINPFEVEFSIDEELIDPLIELTAKELSAGFRFGYEDRRNDSVDKVEGKGEPQQQQRAQQQRRRQ